jgi:hypothetical protein
VKHAYCRCNGGDYFRDGGSCPLDGWSSPESLELADAVEQVRAAGRELSIAELRKVGVSQATLARTIVVEFGCEDAAFEALTPAGYVIDGEWRPLNCLGERFH